MRKSVISTIIVAILLLSLSIPAFAASTHGVASHQPALYDGKLFTISFVEQPAGAEKSLIAHNKSINTIYVSDTPVNGAPFIKVLDAIQGDGFNPLWQEVDITFNVTPFQLTSDTAVLDAASQGLITLTTTNEVYICSVVGPGPKNVHAKH
jgi:hypothetical protein